MKRIDRFHSEYENRMEREKEERKAKNRKEWKCAFQCMGIFAIAFVLFVGAWLA